MLKVGLLGLGAIGKVHKEAAYDLFLKENGPAKIEACFDLQEENFSQFADVRTYTDLDAFFENETGRLDFVDICLPTFMHKDVAIRAMKAGFHVLCEKPMALSFADADEMCRTEKETGKTLMIAQPLRFNADLNLIYDYIQNGTLGKARSVSYFMYSGGLPKGHNNWFRNKALSGGPMFDVHVHDIDTINYLFGAPEAVGTIAAPIHPETTFNTMSSNYQYKDGLCIHLQSDWALPVNKHSPGRCMRINFEKGYIVWEKDTFVKVDNEGNIEKLFADEGKGMFYKEIKYFSECLLHKQRPEKCLPEDVATTMKIICSEIKSAGHYGERVPL